MKIAAALLTLIYIPFLATSQDYSDAENKLYNNYANYAEIMWTLEEDQPCVANQAKCVANESYVLVYVKTNNFRPIAMQFPLLEHASDDTLNGSGDMFFNGIVYKKNGYRMTYNENGQIVKMASDFVRKQNYMKNGDNVLGYYYTTTYDIGYVDKKIHTVKETRYIFKNPKKMNEGQSVVVRAVEVNYKSDSILQKKLSKQPINAKDMELETPHELISDHEYFENGNYQLTYYRANGTLESKALTSYTNSNLPEVMQLTSYLENGDLLVKKETYTYQSDNNQATHVIEQYKNDQFLGRTEVDYVAGTEYRFNSENDLIFEKKNGLFRAKDKTTGEWSDWKEMRWCIN